MLNSIRNLYLERDHLIQFSPELTGLCLQPQEPGGQIGKKEQQCDLKKNIVCCAGGKDWKKIPSWLHCMQAGRGQAHYF